MSNVGGIPDPRADIESLTNAVLALRDAVQVLQGDTGAPLDQAVRIRDLIDYKLLTANASSDWDVTSLVAASGEGGASTIAGYADRQIIWVQDSGTGTWTPTTPQDVVVTLLRGTAVIATHTIRGSLDISTGAINVTTVSNTGEVTNLNVTNNSTSTPLINVQHDVTGVTVPVTMASVEGGQAGPPGADGDPGEDGLPGADGVIPAGTTWGAGLTNIKMIINENASGDPAPGYIHFTQGTLLLPDGSRRELTAEAHVQTPYLNSTVPPSAGGTFYIIWGGTNPDTRFGAAVYGNGIAETKGLFTAYYVRPQWTVVDSANVATNFDAIDTDIIFAVAFKNSAAGGIDSISPVAPFTGLLGLFDSIPSGEAIDDGIVDTQHIVDSAINASKIAPATITINELGDLSVGPDQLGLDAVQTINIAPLAVTSTELDNDAVIAAKILSGAVTAGKIAVDAVTAANIVNGTITSGEIAPGTIAGSNLAPGAITELQLATNAVTANKILANAIVAGKIAAGAIQASALQANSVTANSIAANAVTASEIAANAVTASEIAANAITANEIAAGTITGLEIKGDTITGNNIAANTITGAQILANSVQADRLISKSITAEQIAANVITAQEIAAGTISAAQIVAGTITSLQIAAGTIEAGDIKANTITGGQIAAGSIAADRLAVNNLAAISANLGTVTAGVIDASLVTVANINASNIAAGNLSADYINIDGVTLDTDGAGNLIVRGGGVRTNEVADNAVTDRYEFVWTGDQLGSIAAWPLSQNSLIPLFTYNSTREFTLEEPADIFIEWEFGHFPIAGNPNTTRQSEAAYLFRLRNVTTATVYYLTTANVDVVGWGVGVVDEYPASAVATRTGKLIGAPAGLYQMEFRWNGTSGQGRIKHVNIGVRVHKR